jgi:pimeloyl-ACP methyl ester carboxylesterase
MIHQTSNGRSNSKEFPVRSSDAFPSLLQAAGLVVLVVLGSSVAFPQKAEIKTEIVRVDAPIAGLKLALHHAFKANSAAQHHSPIVLFAEGSAVPTSGNAAFKIAGLSWMDDLAANGFDAWSVDYLGYGDSDRYPENTKAPVGRAADCATQVETAARFILKQQHAQRLSLIGDSFGSQVAGVLATQAPELLDKLILFAPVTPPSKAESSDPVDEKSKFDFVSVDDIWQTYSSWVPKGQSAGLDHEFFVNAWGPKYLASDPTSAQRNPASVMVPNGPDVDAADVQAGRFSYDPAKISTPTLVIFGEWDSVATEEGGRHLFDLLTGAPAKRRIVIGHGTHILQLEPVRFQLYREVRSFLTEDGSAK